MPSKHNNCVSSFILNIPPRFRAQWLITAIRRHGNSNECLLWPFQTYHGYGTLKFRGYTTRAHRIAFYLKNGYWPKPYGCHTCDVRNCFNPLHVWQGTPSENQYDRVRKGRHKGAMAGGMPPGAGCVWAKLTEKQVRQIRKEYIPQIVGCDQLAKKYGVGQHAIYKIVVGKSWRNLL